MFTMDSSKKQGDDIPTGDGHSPDVIVSPNTRRRIRIPPGQSRTKKCPVLDASGAPGIDLAQWRFRISGMVGKEVEWTWEEFLHRGRKCSPVVRISLTRITPGQLGA